MSFKIAISRLSIETPIWAMIWQVGLFLVTTVKRI